MISSVTLTESTWATGNTKFEAGTPIAEAVALATALDWLEQAGRANIHAHASRLAKKFAACMESIPEIELFYPGTGSETIVSFRHKTLHAHDLATILDGRNVAVRAGHHCAWPLVQKLGVDALVRASFAAYSDDDDVEQAIDAIKEAKFLLK